MLLSAFIGTNGTCYTSVSPGREHAGIPNWKLAAFIALHCELDTTRVCSHWQRLWSHCEVPPPRTSRGVCWARGDSDLLTTKASKCAWIGHNWRARMGRTGWMERFTGLRWLIWDLESCKYPSWPGNSTAIMYGVFCNDATCICMYLWCRPEREQFWLWQCTKLWSH